MQYHLVVFDRIQADLPVPHQFADVQALQQSLKRNPPCTKPQSDRLPHLAEILLERFPIEGTDEQECIWHVGEQYEEEFGNLLGDAQAAVNHAWTIISPGGDHLITVMHELLPLLRAFQLDLFDLTGGFYLCNAGHETSCWRLESGEPLDPDLYFPEAPPIDLAKLAPFVDHPGRPPSSLLVFDLFDLNHWDIEVRREMIIAGMSIELDPESYCEEIAHRVATRLPNAVSVLQNSKYPPSWSQRLRLERLVVELLKRFPYPRPSEEEVWQESWPLAQIQTQSIQAWRPSICPERYAEFMAVLLPLARELRLGVIDVHLGAYFAELKTAVVIPSHKQALLAQLDPSSVGWKKPTTAKMIKACQRVLDPVLIEAGFVPQLVSSNFICIYRREIAGGYQQIEAFLLEIPRHNKKRLHIKCESYSMRKAKMRVLEQLVAKGKTSDEIDATRVYEPVCVLRKYFPLLQPPVLGSKAPNESLLDCHTETQAKYIAEQVIARGLPMLDEARTVQGMLRLYSDPQWSDCVDGNLHGAWQRLDPAMVYYAHVAQDERVEQWTQSVLQSYENRNDWSDTEKQKWRSEFLLNLPLWKQYEPVDPDGVA